MTGSAERPSGARAWMRSWPTPGDTGALDFFVLPLSREWRPGEILGLQLRDVREYSVRVERRVYRGDVDSPKRGRARKVALSSASLFLLEEWIPLTLEDQRPGQDFEVHRPTTKLRLGLRYDEIAFPVLLHALPCLRLFRRENRGDLCVVFCVNCLQRLLSGLLGSVLV